MPDAVTEQSGSGIGLLVCQPERRRRLAEELREFGYPLVFDGDPFSLKPEDVERLRPGVWLLEVSDDWELADLLLEQTEVPVLCGAGDMPAAASEDYPRWRRRLLERLADVLGPIVQDQLQTQLSRPAWCVWLLGASFGGPDAVKRFLDRLPAGLPIGFIYAQHIDPGFETQLPRILGRDNNWDIVNCSNGQAVGCGQVMVAPISQRVHFTADRRARLLAQPWPGPYQPSIEVLLDELGRSFQPACGAIIFSGMGEDGVDACSRLRERGIEVWTQDSSSATCAVMPDAIRLAGHSTLEGTPEELADALCDWLQHECPQAVYQ